MLSKVITVSSRSNLSSRVNCLFPYCKNKLISCSFLCQATFFLLNLCILAYRWPLGRRPRKWEFTNSGLMSGAIATFLQATFLQATMQKGSIWMRRSSTVYLYGEALWWSHRLYQWGRWTFLLQWVYDRMLHGNYSNLIATMAKEQNFLMWEIQSTPDNSNRQGKKKKVRIIGKIIWKMIWREMKITSS